MTTYYYTLFIVFSIIAFMIVLDDNVGAYIILIFKILKVNIERFWWRIRFHPNNFITTWMRNREYDKIARELENEIKMERESRSSDNSSKTSE